LLNLHTNVIKIGFYGIGPTEISFGFICYNFLLLTIVLLVETPFGPMSPMDVIVIITIKHRAYYLSGDGLV